MAIFSNREGAGTEAETIISSSVKVEGDLTSGGDIIIDGRVEGTVTTQRNLVVGEQAEIIANVKAANAKIAGHIKGNLEISGKLELGPTSKLQGDVVAKVLVVAEGAQLNGHYQMETPLKVEATTPAAKVASKRAATS